MAVNSILIGKLIYDALSQSENISEAVGDGIYPLVAENETSFPFIVYARTNVYSDGQTKDGSFGDKVGFQVSVASDKYYESAELANEVRELFENCILYNDSLTIKDIKMTSITEAYNDNTYIQTLNFECNAE